MVVDDHLGVLDVASQMLESLGYRAIRSNTSQEALSLARSHSIDLVMSDLMLPGELHGAKLVELIRENSPKTRGLLMSGNRVSELDPGDLKLVYKPFQRDSLASDVHEALNSEQTNGSTS